MLRVPLPSAEAIMLLRRWMTPMPPTPLALEDHLVQAAIQGDAGAFQELHRRFAPTIHAIALSRAPQRDADDLVQETFLRAWQRLPELSEPARFAPWLAAIARNLITDHLRRRRPAEPLPPDLPARPVPSAEASDLLRHLRALPEAYREPLIMRLVEGMSGQEIADHTGLTPGSVRVNLHRGMKLLRQRLGLEDAP